MPGAYQFEAGGDPRQLLGYQEGAFVVQELGAQLVAHALGVREGEAVLDVCAGRGQKTSLLKSLVGNSGRVVATDLHEHKVRALEEEMKRLGVSVTAQTWDWTKEPPTELRGVFDRVIVDAPCSGVGTLRRRPEIARRLTAEDPVRLGALQSQIARNAALALKPDGVLLFATCSVLREEAEDIVEQLIAEGALTAVIPETSVQTALFPQGASPSAALRLLPQIHGTDGYFIARFALSGS